MTAARIPFMAFDTALLPDGMGRQIWRETQGQFYEFQDTANFAARANVWNINGLILGDGQYSDTRCFRSEKRARVDGFDHYTFLLHRRGHWNADAGTRAAENAPGRVCVIDFARPIMTDVADNDSLSLTVPRDLLDEVLPPFDMHCLRVEGSRGALLHDFLLSLSARVGDADAPSPAALSEAIRHMLAACLSPERDAAARAQSEIDRVQLRRAISHIDAHLHEPEWSVEQLCVALRLSRSTLYRLFEPFGGVAASIRVRRLARAHVMLADHSERRSVSEIAVRCGFQSDSSFSRAFRQAFGYSPREARLAPDIGMGGQTAVSGSEADQTVFVDWIHRLRMPRTSAGARGRV